MTISRFVLCVVPQHNRFVSDSKDKEPDVLFVGDSLIQLMHQFAVRLLKMPYVSWQVMPIYCYHACVL